MSFYQRYLFPHVLDWVMHQPAFFKPRRRVLEGATGHILEIGFGTGANLPHYPSSVTALEALDPESMLAPRVAERIASSGRQVTFHQLSGEQLPFEQETFDTVVCTLTLCSVTDPQQVLREVVRVLRPGGKFLFLEHGASPDASVLRWQHRLNGIQQYCGGGCQLIRPVKQLVEQSGLVFQDLSQYYMSKVPRFMGYMSEGCACKTVG